MYLWEYKQNRKTFREEVEMINYIKSEMYRTGLHKKEICDILGIKVASYNYKLNNNAWKPEEIVKLANAFGCTTDFLLTGKK